MKTRIIISVLLLTISSNLFAGRPNDIEFAVQHLITSIEMRTNDIITEEKLNLKVLDHYQKSYYSSQYFKLNFIEDGLIVSSSFPNEVKVVFFPVIKELENNSPFTNEDHLDLILTISNKDQYFSKKFNEVIEVRIKIICSDQELKDLLQKRITVDSLIDNFKELNKNEEMMRSYKMVMTLV